MTNTDKIKELRERTGLSLGQIKKALDEAGDDESKAIEILKERGLATALKKSSREVKEGVIDSYIHANRKLGAIVEVLCETDFVAKNADFVELAHDLAMHIAAARPENSDDLLSQPFIKDQAVTVRDIINSHIAKLGENIQVGRFDLFEI